MYIIRLFSLLLCVISLDAGIIQDSISYQHGYNYYPGAGWVYFHPIPTQWKNARLRCLYEGAELMSPLNEWMLQAMREAGKTAMWTGVHDTYSKGDYYSIDGVPMSEMPITWAKDEPDNENDSEDCLIMLPAGTMADCSCNESYPFSCYKANDFKSSPCDGLQGYEFDQKTGNCYKFHTLAETWVRAFMTCAAEGAHLAVIDSPGEKEVLKNLFNNYPSHVIRGADYNHAVQLGFLDWDNHMLWMTINGKKIDDLVADKLAYWEQDEPNNVGNVEYCGSMTRKALLNDAPCTKYKMPFICEYEKNKKNSSVLQNINGVDSDILQ